MRTEAVYEVGDLVGTSVRRVGKFIDRHPRGAGRNTGVSGVQMLMEASNAEADNGDVHTSTPSVRNAATPARRGTRRVARDSYALVIADTPVTAARCPSGGPTCRSSVAGIIGAVLDRVVTGPWPPRLQPLRSVRFKPIWRH